MNATDTTADTICTRSILPVPGCPGFMVATERWGSETATLPDGITKILVWAGGETGGDVYSIYIPVGAGGYIDGKEIGRGQLPLGISRDHALRVTYMRGVDLLVAGYGPRAARQSA